jgi:hypothetical protein
MVIGRFAAVAAVDRHALNSRSMSHCCRWAAPVDPPQHLDAIELGRRA